MIEYTVHYTLSAAYVFDGSNDSNVAVFLQGVKLTN